MSAPVLITGGSGFLGTHLAAVLTEAGASVRSLGRSHSDALEALGVEQIKGSVLDEGDVAKAVEGARAIYHLAGQVSRDKSKVGAMQALHVAGTRNIIEAAKAAGIEEVLVVSTSGTVGVSDDPDFEGDEDSPYPWDLIGSWPYYESKAFAEKEALRYVEEGFPVKIARPSLLLGPGDTRGSSTEDVVRFLAGKVKAALPGGVSAVDVRDVAAVLPSLMAKGEPGVGYMLTGANLSVRDFLLSLEQASGVRAPSFEMPKALVDRAGGLLKRVSKLKAMGDIDEQTFEMGCRYWYVTSDRARAELGFQTRPFEDTIRDTVNDLMRGERPR
ncbi:MAG: NAD-dependent epimerase/dehydratase family protein [Bradymonadia bacterium]